MNAASPATTCRQAPQSESSFFKGLVSQPKTVGAIVPTSIYMARRMASVANPASNLPILELGPGTGVVTKPC